MPPMAGWSVRLWRRSTLLPGVRLNVSRGGLSLSVGPRGAHLTVSKRGLRETVGVPGTGVYATKVEKWQSAPPPHQSTASPAETQPALEAPPAGGNEAAKPHAGPAHYSVAVVVGIVVGVIVLAAGGTGAGAATATLVTGLVGIGYEWLAHHHPAAAKALVAAAAGLATIAAIAAGVLLVLALAVGVSSGRRRR